MIRNEAYDWIALFMFFKAFFKKVLPKSISSRFFIILITPVVMSQIILGTIFFGEYAQTILKTTTNQITGDIKALLHIIESNSGNLEQIKRDLEIDVSILKNATIKEFGIKRNSKVYRMLRNSFKHKGIEEYYIAPNGTKITAFIRSANGQNVYKMSFARKKIYTRGIPLVLGWGVASSIVLLIIAFIFLKNQIRPIKRLSLAMESFGVGIDNNSFIPEGAKEIRAAGKSFCDMRNNLRAMVNNKMKALAGISHDLRTPLTKMKLQLSIMQKNKEIDMLLRDVNDMIRITESFTLHAFNQNKEIFIKRGLYLFLHEISKGIDGASIIIEGDRSVEASIKYISLKRAFVNIISNAVKYSKNIYISFESSEDSVIIYFEDDGIGIDEEAASQIFAPFVSSDLARNHNDCINIGLGLSIARDAILDHGGDICAKNSKKYGGACFVVKLPFG